MAAAELGWFDARSVRSDPPLFGRIMAIIGSKVVLWTHMACAALKPKRASGAEKCPEAAPLPAYFPSPRKTHWICINLRNNL